MDNAERCSRAPLASVVTAAALLASPAWAQPANYVAGELIELSTTSTVPNGAWSWYSSQRAIVDTDAPGGPRIMVGSVSSAPNGDEESGDIDALWYDVGTGLRGEFELANRFERDDHDDAVFMIREDGRYLAMYARHGGDNYSRWRVSTLPHNADSWGPENVLNNGAGTTYSNVYYLPNDRGGLGRTYNFARTVNYDPNVDYSNDNGLTWSYGGRLVSSGGSGDRPYLRYASDGQTIHFIATERHPRDYNNSIYHGYVQDGVLYDSFGNVLDSDLFSATVQRDVTALTKVFDINVPFGGITYTRAWTVDIEMDASGHPVALFEARANGSDLDHRFFYATFDGSSWSVHYLAKAGGYLYAAENDYTGLVSIDPNDTSIVYLSSKIDPGTGATTDHYEIYSGRTADGGATWTWGAITANSGMDNIRPIVPSWSTDHTALLWLRGTYSTYTSWDTEVVLMVDPPVAPTYCAAEFDGVYPTDFFDMLAYLEAFDAGCDSGSGDPDPLTYVDADFATNTDPDSAYAGVAAQDNLWGTRSAGTNGTVLESSGVASGLEDSPEIYMTLAGLTPGQSYDIYVNFYDVAFDSNQTWTVRAGFTPGNLTLYANGDDGGANLVGAEPAGESSLLDYANPPKFDDGGNRHLFAGFVGSIDADTNGEIRVYVDDMPSPNGANRRTWYDGISYHRTPPPPCLPEWDGVPGLTIDDLYEYLTTAASCGP
ncbi:MAG: hypothetical protein H6810_02095 [Phycisphaeraceae bacterium]|nr:MAG: hypothetical protein H6810_02095 [Phycisphaeraceae bacterium]